jgi:CelD/BcsL family acetyltransferase involved in cellulose biosynthesis
MALLVPRDIRRGPFKWRQFCLNTDGEPPGDSVVIENNGLLCREDLLVEASRALADEIRASRVDEFVASGIDERHLRAFLAAFSDWHADVEARPSFVVDLTMVRAKGGDVLQCVSSNTRSQIRRAVRRYEESARLDVEMATSATEAVAMLEELIDLHNNRWSAEGQSGAFASAARRSFHFDFVSRGVQHETAVLLRICSGPTTIGVLYFLCANGMANFYQGGFARTDDPHLKPGLISHCFAIRHFADRGFSEYDFLASPLAESRYKQSLSTGQRTLYWLTLARPNLKNTLLEFARRARLSFR